MEPINLIIAVKWADIFAGFFYVGTVTAREELLLKNESISSKS